MKRPEIKYIQGVEDYGILYDWRFLRKEYKKLNCPPEVFNPCDEPLETAKYFVDVSERNIGKTTNWILLGLLMNKFYGTNIQYVRQSEEEIMPKSIRDLFKTILKYKYIEKITEGQYNSVVYKSRRFYYALTDDSGQIIDQAAEHFMFCCCVEKAQDLKSSYNAPLGDLIIFDEFIRKYYYTNEFIQFEDLVKTILRGRRSPIIAMCANSINPHTPYYNELEIYDTMCSLKIGEKKLVKTDKGTVIHCHMVGTTVEKKRKNSIINQLFFGFKNPLLGAITGENIAIDSYPHIPEPEEGEADPEYITRRLYLLHSSKLVRFDVVRHEKLGICLYAHWASRTYNDSIIMTVEARYDKRYQSRLGRPKLEKFMKRCFREDRIYYATNDIGSFVENYVKNVCKIA